MRQAGVLCAAALVGLDTAEERLRIDHQRTKKLAQGKWDYFSHYFPSSVAYYYYYYQEGNGF